MCNHENLPNRVKKANAAMLFAKVEQYDSKGRVAVVQVPGSNGKVYHVEIKRGKQLLVNCLNENYCDCQSSVVCYHAMAAIQVAAKGQGYTVVWCANEQHAKKLANLGGKAVEVARVKNPYAGKMFGVIREVK